VKTRFQGSDDRAFTLVMVLTILAAVTILVVGLFGIVNSERQISASFDAVEQADLAVQAGLARATAMLGQSLMDETGVVFAMPANVPLDEPRTPVPVLLTANYDFTSKQWRYQPLISGAQAPAATATLQKPASTGLGYEPQPVNAQANQALDRQVMRRQHPAALPSQAPPLAWWETLSLPASIPGPDGESAGQEKISARFCFHIEDLQGLLNLSHTGNLDGTDERHSRHRQLINGPHVVPGLNLAFADRPLLNQSALYSIFNPLAQQDTSDLARHLVKSRRLIFTPEAWKEIVIQPDTLTGWPGRDAAAYLARDAASSRFTETSARALEEHTISGLESYFELALIPPDPAFVSDGRLQPGTRKLNLNRLLAAIEALPADQRQARAQQAVDEIAGHIRTHLPDFDERRGGYPLGADPEFAYLQCLAAGIIDYADTDSMPTMKVLNETDPVTMRGEYRGMDAFPIVSEQWQRYRFESSYTEDGSQFIDYSVTQYLELWNMTNKPVNGVIQSTFECDGELTASAGIYDVKRILRGEEAPDATVKAGMPDQEGDFWWHPTIPVTLQPNQYIVVRCQPVLLKLRSGLPAPPGATATVSLRGYQNNRDRTSKYRIRFGPAGSPLTLVDFPQGKLDRFDWAVNNTSNRQRFNTNLPGMSYSDANQAGTFANNIGDPRAAFFIDYLLDQVNYPNNSSPWSRNIRFNNVTRFFGENRGSLWPDGGHNSPLRPSRVNDYNNNPDTPLIPALAVEPEKYVQRLSNEGRLFSVTELGHVFDPIMWDPDGGSPYEPPGDMQYRDFADIRPGDMAKSSIFYCGGNTLRVGRPEHSRFRPAYGETIPNRPANRSMCATALLDLFHTGIPQAVDEQVRAGDFQRIHGHVNINTASKQTLQALVAGALEMDTAIQYPAGSADAAIPRPGTPESASLIADEIILRRPFLSASELPERLLASDGQPLLGRTHRKSDREVFPEWNDSAAEEAFARLFNSSTVRSRHFRVVVTGQCYRESRSGAMNVLATRSRLYHVFVRPVRGEDGVILRNDIQITYARNF